MKRDLQACAAIALALTFSSSAKAALTRQEIAQAALAPAQGAALPQDAILRETDGAALSLGAASRGKPTLVAFVDYTCKRVCGTLIDSLALTLQRLPFREDFDYSLVLIGFNPANTSTDAEAFRSAHFGETDFARRTHFLTAAPEAIAQLSQAAGLTVTYDADHDEFAHPIGVLVTTPEGRISSIVNPLSVTAFDLRLALVEAAQGRLGSMTDRIALLCYGWDAVTGVYTVAIWRILGALSLITLAFFGAGARWLVRRERHSAL